MNRMAAATVATANGDSVLRSDRDVPLTPRMADSAAHDYSSPQDSITTPTRRSFAGLPGQLPLPKEPLSEQTDVHRRAHSRTASFASSRHTRDLDDIDMDDADMDTAVEDDISGDESVTSERPSKKKKGQRFFCTEFPPCQLSFTRSEHLARHIRKHTGERPFQCHCSRRFSRLDNLRQHAQTVHVNEEIPGDSLAATSTRFQRQIRTDRVKSSGGRSRTSAPSSGGPARGHSRNLSASSVGSTSSFSLAEETRPRPTLAIATGAKRSSGAMEDYNHAESSQHLAQSGLSTPTSQTFAGSPSFTPGYASPASAVSRSSFYNGSRHSRRLSVPTGPNPFQQPMHPASYYTPVSSQASVYSSTSGYGSPTSSIYSPGRRDSETEIEYRRRTWHPTTQTNYSQRPATSGLSYHQTPDEPRPAASQQPAASQVTRLPGIESFDHVAQPASRAPPSPMMLDSRPSTSDRQEAGLHQGFHRLEIAASQLPDLSYQQPPTAAQAYAPTSYSNMPQQPRHQHHISMPEVPMTPRKTKRQAWYGGPIGPSTAVQQSNLAPFRPSPEDSGSSDGAPTPLTFQGQEYHPVIVNHEQPVHPVAEEQEKSQFPSTPTMLPPTSVRTQDYQKPAVPVRADSGFQGYIPSQPTSVPVHRPYDAPPADFYTRYTSTNIDGRSFDHNHDMGRLEALVAVATSENRAVQNQQ